MFSFSLSFAIFFFSLFRSLSLSLSSFDDLSMMNTHLSYQKKDMQNRFFFFVDIFISLEKSVFIFQIDSNLFDLHLDFFFYVRFSS